MISVVRSTSELPSWTCTSTVSPALAAWDRAAFLLSLVIGIPAGVLAAVRPNLWLTKIFKGISLTGVSVPNFVIAHGDDLPVLGAPRLAPDVGHGQSWKHFIMPTIALGWYFAAATMRLVQSSMLDVMGGEYVKLARPKACPSDWSSRSTP